MTNFQNLPKQHATGIELSVFNCVVALLLWQVDRVVTPILYVVGVTGNTLSAIVWLQRRMHANNSSAVYLVALSVSDLLFLLLHFVQVGDARTSCS